MPSLMPSFPGTLNINNQSSYLFNIFPISDFNIDVFTYEALLGYRFDLSTELSFNAYYHNINRTNQIILAEHTWWRQLLVPRSTNYSVFDDLKLPIKSSARGAGVDSFSFVRFESKNSLNIEQQNLLEVQPSALNIQNQTIDDQNMLLDSPFSIESTSLVTSNSLTYWMILPKIVDNPFLDFSQKSQFNLSNSDSFYEKIANNQYAPKEITKTGEFNGYGLHYLLGTTVRCIAECSDKFVITDPPKPDIPEASHILSFIVLGIVCCARIIKRFTP